MTNPGIPPIIGSGPDVPPPFTPEQIEQQNQQEVARLLNSQGFAAFLGEVRKHEPDIDDRMGDAEYIREKFELFKSTKEVADGMKAFYKGGIKEKLGIDLTPKDLEAIDAHIAKVAAENPDELKQLAETATDYQAGPERVKAAETAFQDTIQSDYTIAELRVMAEQHNEAIEVLEESIGHVGFAGFVKGIVLWRASRKDGYRQFGSPFVKDDALERDIDKHKKATGKMEEFMAGDNPFKEAISSIVTTKGFEKFKHTLAKRRDEIVSKIQKFEEADKNLTSAMEKHAQIKKGMLMTIGGMEGVAATVRGKLDARMTKIMSKRRLSSVAEAQAAHEQAVGIDESGELGFDLFNIDPNAQGSIESNQAGVDRIAGDIVREKVSLTINRLRPGRDPLTSLERPLMDVLSLENLGSAENGELLDLIEEAFEDAIDLVSDDDPDKGAKAILARAVVTRLRAGVYKKTT